MAQFCTRVLAQFYLRVSNYFRLGKPLERRLYEIARKHAAKKTAWKIGLETLKEKTRSTSTLNKFRHFIKEIEKTNYLPDYRISVSDKDIITFWQKRPQESIGLDDLPTIKSETIFKGAHIVENAGTGWDYGELRSQFTEQLQKGFKPDSPDGAFINFIKKKVVNRP